MSKIWELDDPELPAELATVRSVFMPGIQLPKNMKKSDRRHGESLHDYLGRKNVKCFCRNCAADRKRLADENNGTLL